MFLAAVGAAGTACGPAGSAPTLTGLADAKAFVGVEFTLDLQASDPDRDPLFYSFASSLPELSSRAIIRPFGDGSNAQFVWTPQASDVGLWAIDISVTDGEHTTTETVTIEVKASEGAGAPIFRKPLGTGTTLDLAVKNCLDVDVLVEDADSNEVDLTMQTPIEGSTLEQSGPFTALWTWCPTEAQIAAQDRYSLVLSAKDTDNPETVKNFLIVLRKAPKPGCEGAGPVVTHTPADQSTTLPVLVDAVISDDLGLKNEPLVYYSTTPPANPPDLGTMQQATMLLLDGNMQNGTWAVELPNPVAASPMGTSAQLHYVIVAQDNDDATGDCDHLTQSPSSGAYSMTVTNPGGGGGLGVCEACTADAQCGGASDNCVRIGNMSQSFCGKACTADTDCAADYYCSITMLTSVDGVAARQCIPDDYQCGDAPPPPTCMDDPLEDNDTRTIAAGKAALATGTHNLVSCPDGTVDDEDFFKIEITGDAQVMASISGGAATDLDLALLDSTGATIVKSESNSSSESVSSCLTPGTYFLRVYAWGSPIVKNDYTLTWSRTAMSCSAMCTDDSNEPDDTYQAATVVDLDVTPKYTFTTGQVCTMDEDWYRVYLFANETIHATAAFTQTAPDEDLDLQLYKQTTNLYPCTETNTSGCGAANGSSTDSNETLVKTVTEEGNYYVVVRGWQGAVNSYSLCIGLTATDCPDLP